MDFGDNIYNALKYLRGDRGQARYLFIYPGNATGDLAHVMPVLKDPAYCVLVVDGLPAAQRPCTNGMKAIVDVMVHQFNISPAQLARACSKDDTKQLPAVIQEAQKIATKFEFARIFQLADATKLLRSQYLGDKQVPFSGKGARSAPDKQPTYSPRELQAVIHGNGLLPAEPTQDFDKILHDAGINQQTLSRPLVVLWGRHAAKPHEGGVHYDLNHSNFGWAQVTARCIRAGFSVVVAGQFEKDKWEKHGGFQGSHFIGEFYRNPALTRPQQLYFFHYLGRLLVQFGGKKFLHVGMRSGGLDLFGFGGQPVLYVAIEKLSNEQNLVGDERMKGFAASAQAAGMPYNRFRATEQPKRWTAEGDNVKPDERRKANPDSNGFSGTDLEALVSQIQQLLE